MYPRRHQQYGEDNNTSAVRYATSHTTPKHPKTLGATTHDVRGVRHPGGDLQTQMGHDHESHEFGLPYRCGNPGGNINQRHRRCVDAHSSRGLACSTCAVTQETTSTGGHPAEMCRCTWLTGCGLQYRRAVTQEATSIGGHRLCEDADGTRIGLPHQTPHVNRNVTQTRMSKDCTADCNALATNFRQACHGNPLQSPF